jgi:hypothetical protein
VPNAPIELGETYNYAFQAKDAAGVNIAPGTVTAVVSLPDGTTANPTVTGTSPATIAYISPQVGRHVLNGTASGGALGSDVKKFEDVFHVEPAGRYVVGIDEALSHLAAVGILTGVNDIEQLRWYILAASDAVERDLGRIVARRSVTEVYDGGDFDLALRSTPVVSVTSVVEAGVSVAASGYTLNATTGVLLRGGTTSPQLWQWGRQNVTVTYVAGMPTVPAVIRLIVLSVVERMWQAAQNAGHPGLVDDVSAPFEAAAAVAASLPPPLLAAYDRLRVGGFA